MWTKTKDKDPALSAAIDSVLQEMTTTSKISPEYAKLVDQLSKLYKIRDEVNVKSRVNPDTLAIVLGNLAGVLLIVSYEKHQIVTSKALTFVQKLR